MSDKGLTLRKEIRPKILVVDPNPVSRQQLERLVAEMGAEPRGLANTRQAVELVHKQKFEGVLLEWGLAGPERYQLIEGIRNSRSNSKIPIALATERQVQRSVVVGFQGCATFFLAKPVDRFGLGRFLDCSRTSLSEAPRRYQRFALAVPVVCKWKEGRATGETINVSASGLLMHLNECPQPGIPVSVHLTIPQPWQRLELAGLVTRRAAGQQVGIQFVGVLSEQHELLASCAGHASRGRSA